MRVSNIARLYAATAACISLWNNIKNRLLSVAEIKLENWNTKKSNREYKLLELTIFPHRYKTFWTHKTTM